MGEGMEKCYYRQKPPQGYPVDYYMGPKEQKNCKGKETCAPKRPKPLTKKEEIDEFFKKVKEKDFMNLRPPIMRKKCYGVIAPNMSEQEKAEAGRLPDGYFDTMREIYAAMSIQQKVNDKKRNVVVVEHGSAHMHRGRLPAFIKYFNPDAKVFVVILDGDRHLPTMLFDKTVKELGWEDRNFILRLGPDFLEGDLVVHLATRGREQEQSRIPSPGILIHTYQPLP